MSELAVFDLDAVGTAAEHLYVLDDRGRAHLCDPSAGELTFTPEGATARCDIALVGSKDGDFRPGGERLLIHNRHVLPLDRAVALAMMFSWMGGRRRQDREPNDADVQLQMLVATSKLEDPELPSEFLTEIALMRLEFSRGEATVRAVLTDPVHPVWLALAFSEGRVLDDAVEYQENDREVATPDGAATEAAMLFGEQIVAILRLPGEELVRGFIVRPQDESFEDSAHFRLPAQSVLLLLAVHEGLQYVEHSEGSFDDVDTAVVAPVRDGLERLRGELLSEEVELDWVAGFRRLTELFASWSWPAGAEKLPVRQLTAIATTAMRKWAARHGRPSLSRPIDTHAIEQLSGHELVRLDDGYALRCYATYEITFRIEGDLAVGRARTITPNGELESTPTVISARTFEWIAWALAAQKVITPDALDEAIRHSLANPWFDRDEPTRQALAELTRIARGHLPRSRRRRARELLRSHPGT